ncbi:AraC family transcriptional regulator [Ornithinibacillus sp. L9]|uniref:AraC family transcriptional regulator n=1 Tax=Ornithinibacillus caprae TaxID=2678566 RepID=A0A6N8FDT5_9BACI|nr:GyrI-like domain-containing protein [Ornithinibacillus caprae]MUK87575.1 AraC family transcriptional regulator [Ornithinibacillus caprae]
MEPKVVQKNAIQIIGYEFEANLKEIEEQQLGKKTLEKLKESVDEIENKVGDHVYMTQIYPMREDFDAEVHQFKQIIGFEVDELDSNIPKGAVRHTIPENDYVCYTHHGLESELHNSYSFLYGKWLEENGYVPLGYDVELWGERYQPYCTDNQIDLFIAVKSK